MPCAPWHIVQLSASVAPRPTASVVAGARHRSFEHHVGRTVAALPARRPLRTRSSGTPAARQMLAQSPCAREVGVHRGQPRRSRRAATRTVSTTSDTTLQRNQGLRQEIHAVLRASPAPDRNDGHRGLLRAAASCAIGIAVVDDRQADHHRHPQREAVRARPACCAPGCAGRLKVNGRRRCRRRRCARGEDEDEQERRDDQQQPADGRRGDRPGLRLQIAGCV